MMTDAVDQGNWLGFFLYGRRELKDGHSCKRIVIWPPSRDLHSEPVFNRDEVIALLQPCSDELFLHKVRSPTLTFHLLFKGQRVCEIRAHPCESVFDVSLRCFASVFLTAVSFTTKVLRSNTHSVVLYQHFFRTGQVNRDGRQSKACRKFVASLRNWGTENTRQVVESVYERYLYHPPIVKHRDFTTFLNEFHGFIDLVASVEGDKKKGFRFVWNEKNFILESLTLIHPIVRSVVECSKYYQLDTSFYVFTDYVYCVPQFIVRNCSIPIGIIIGRSENAGLYSSLFRAVYLWDKALASTTKCDFHLMEKFQKLPFVSDNHSSLRAYADAHNITQYLCHRHIIENYGSNSLVAICVRLLLDCYSEMELQEQMQVANGIIKERFMRLAQQGCQKSSFLDVVKKFGEFSGQSIAVEDGELKFIPRADRTQTISKWALWMRQGASSCSNHSEAFHHVLNESIRTKGGKPHFYSALLTTETKITQKQKQWKEYAAKNLKKLYGKIKRCSGDEVNLPCRFCRFGEKIRDRYDVCSYFPCQHLTKQRQKDAFDVFSKEVESKLSGITIESDEEKLPRLFQMTEIPSASKTEKDTDSPPSDGETQNIDKTGHALLNGQERKIEKIAYACYRQFKKKISFHWVLTWIHQRLKKQFATELPDLSIAYEVAIDEIERRVKTKQLT